MISTLRRSIVQSVGQLFDSGRELLAIHTSAEVTGCEPAESKKVEGLIVQPLGASPHGWVGGITPLEISWTRTLKTMTVGIPKNHAPQERRVALTPAVIPTLAKKGIEVYLEMGAGIAAGYPDSEYEAKGAKLVSSGEELFSRVAVILTVRPGDEELRLAKPGQIVIGFFDPLSDADLLQRSAEAGVTAFAMELIPRISRAQSMDALSSMATVSGYKAVLMAADRLPKMMPMLMTAAGTVVPAKVFVIGAGVAGLQAIATAKRLGAVVSAYDVRPAVRDQVESLGAKFVELPLETKGAEDKGGYAKDQGEEFLGRQRELMTRVVAESDVVITTAAIPGKPAPVLITAEMVSKMTPGSVIVDLAAERGGNCELTRAEELVEIGGVTILGPTNLPSTIPFHSSQMYSRNLSTFLLHLADKGVGNGTAPTSIDDPIVRDTLLTYGGKIVNPRLRKEA